MSQKYKILVVEDEKDIRDLTAEILTEAGYEVSTAVDGHDGLQAANRSVPDVIILDIMMPRVDGVTACNSLRSNDLTRHVPIIMLTANREEAQRIRAFSAGADDFISKPFSPDELLVRVKSKVRRLQEKATGKPSILSCGNLSVNKDNLEVKVAENLVSLSLLEFNLLTYLVENHDRLCSRQQIVENVWGDATVSVRLLDPHILSIRRKIKGSDFDISTVYGGGYIFKLQAAEAIDVDS